MEFSFEKLPDSLTAESLLSAPDFLDSIIENLPDMVFVKEAKELRFVRINRAGEELLGLPRAVLLGKNDYDFFPREQADFFVAKDRAVLSSGQMLDIQEEPIHTRKNGTRYLHTKKIPLQGKDGSPLFLLGISEDVTDRKRVQAELHQNRNLEAIGRLAGGVAHDFNNLMTGIQGVTEDLLSQQETPSQLRPELEEILNASQRASTLTKQLLAFGRRQMIAPRVLDMNSIVAEMKPLLRRLIGADIELHFALEPALGHCRIDPGQLEQILLNTVLNARDAMPTGGAVTIQTQNVQFDMATTRFSSDRPQGPFVMLSVVDTGMGMNAETQQHAFEPFYTTKTKDKGTGLGLATVYGIVKQNSGEIFLDSVVGRETTLQIFLPRVAQENPNAQEVRLKDSPRGHETVLVVEDEDLVRRVVVKALSKRGYLVLQARDGKEAIQIGSQHPTSIDLLLTDVIMPGLNGHQVAELLTPVRPSMKVLYMSGYTEDVIVDRGILKPGIQFIEKTFSAEILCQKVRSVLEASASA